MFKRRRAAKHESWAQWAVGEHQGTGEPDLLDIAVEQAALAVDASGRRERDDRLLLLAEALVERGESAPSGGDLEAARAMLADVWGRAGSSPPRQGRCALDTAWVLANQGIRDASVPTLDEALEWISRSRETFTGDRENLLRVDHTEAYAIAHRYWLTREDVDLETLRQRQQRAAAEDDWTAVALARWYAAVLVSRYQSRADPVDLREAVDLLSGSLRDEGLPTIGVERVRLEVLLGQAYLHLYEREFDPSLLDRALTWCERGLHSTDPEDGAYLSRLDLVLWARCHVQQRRGAAADYDAVIDTSREALTHADRWPGPIVDARLNLSELLLDRYDLQGSGEDVAEAAALAKQALDADPTRQDDEPRRGRVTLARYEVGGGAEVLDAAIEELRCSWEAMPAGLPARLDARFRLALALRYRSELTGSVADGAAARNHVDGARSGVHPDDPRRWLYERWTERIRRP